MGLPKRTLRNQVLDELVAERTIQLSEANVELERLNRLKTQFLGMAAHDLRSPIGHILSYSDFLREEVATVLTEEQLESPSIIRNSSEFMLPLIDDFLDVSLIKSGKLHLDPACRIPSSCSNATLASTPC
jgi:signal transduction histidine kinase